MTSRKSSRIMAVAAMALVVVCLVMCFVMHLHWWTFVDLFFAFLMAFLHLLSTMLWRTPGIARQLETAALICGVLMVVALVVDYFIF